MSYSLTMTLKKDGAFDAESIIFMQPFTYSGSWAFSDDNEDLILTDPTGAQTSEILKLTNSELKLRNIQNGDEIVTTYTAQ
jgi:glutamine cyclotransferase